MRNIVLIASLFFAITLLAACSEKPAEVAVDDADIILFSSQTCPHCLKVKDYIKANDIKSKVSFSEREVGLIGEAKANAEFMAEKQKACKLDEKSVGAIPFLWSKDGKCLLGDEEIINFFREKIS